MLFIYTELDINTFMNSESQNTFLQHNGTLIVPQVQKSYIISEKRQQKKTYHNWAQTRLDTPVENQQFHCF